MEEMALPVEAISEEPLPVEVLPVEALICWTLSIGTAVSTKFGLSFLAMLFNMSAIFFTCTWNFLSLMPSIHCDTLVSV